MTVLDLEDHRVKKFNEEFERRARAAETARQMFEVLNWAFRNMPKSFPLDQLWHK